MSQASTDCYRGLKAARSVAFFFRAFILLSWLNLQDNLLINAIVQADLDTQMSF